MPEFFERRENPLGQRIPDASLVDHLTVLQRQYVRVREYSGFTIDEIVNRADAKRYLRELWLLASMVRKPQKAAQLPPGNPFRPRR